MVSEDDTGIFMWEIGGAGIIYAVVAAYVGEVSTFRLMMVSLLECPE